MAQALDTQLVLDVTNREFVMKKYALVFAALISTTVFAQKLTEKRISVKPEVITLSLVIDTNGTVVSSNKIKQNQAALVAELDSEVTTALLNATKVAGDTCKLLPGADPQAIGQLTSQVRTELSQGRFLFVQFRCVNPVNSYGGNE
jgi:hypothetical protein